MSIRKNITSKIIDYINWDGKFLWDDESKWEIDKYLLNDMEKSKEENENGRNPNDSK